MFLPVFYIKFSDLPHANCVYMMIFEQSLKFRIGSNDVQILTGGEFFDEESILLVFRWAEEMDENEGEKGDHEHDQCHELV